MYWSLKFSLNETECLQFVYVANLTSDLKMLLQNEYNQVLLNWLLQCFACRMSPGGENEVDEG